MKKINKSKINHQPTKKKKKKVILNKSLWRVSANFLFHFHKSAQIHTCDMNSTFPNTSWHLGWKGHACHTVKAQPGWTDAVGLEFTQILQCYQLNHPKSLWDSKHLPKLRYYPLTSFWEATGVGNNPRYSLQFAFFTFLVMQHHYSPAFPRANSPSERSPRG